MSAKRGLKRVSQQAHATGLAQVFQAAGNQIIYKDGEPYRWASWPSPAPPPAKAQDWEQPSDLLRAANAVVDFTGRDALLGELHAWRDRAGARVAGREGVAVELIHGPGGQGKTRLAGRVAEVWQGEGWVVLSAHHRRDRSAPKAFAVPDFERAAGVLVVVDYAERWDTGDLLTLLGDTLIGGRLPVRVLLLARPSGTWWQSLRGRIKRDLHVTATSRELKPLESEAGITRQGLFAAARDRFADLLERPDARQVDPPEALEWHEAYSLVLTVQMAALAAVLTAGSGQGPPSDPVEVSQVLLARERDHWEALHDRREKPLATSPDAMGQLVYTATLTGRLGHADGLAAVEGAAIESREHPGQLLKDHAVCYPPSETFGTAQSAPPVAGDGEITVLEPLYPDRLGEDFLALSTPRHSHDFPADSWAALAPARLLTAPGEASEPGAGSGRVPVWIRHGLITLIEASRRWPHLAQRQLYPLLTARPELALHAGGAALARLARLDDIDPALLEKIEAILPGHRHIDLDIGIAALAVRLAEYRLPDADPVARAYIHHKLARHLSNAGLHIRALAEGQEATRRWRRLAEFNRDAYLPDLATSLNNQANLQAEAGQRDEAMPIIAEAVRMHRELAELNPDAYLPGLAASLNSHAALLAETGQRDEAVPIIAEAVHMHRELAELNPDAYLPGLAVSLNNRANLLAETGQRREAVPISAEAVCLRRELAELNRAAYLPDLAVSLYSHAKRLAETGQRDEAVPIIAEAVRLERELAELNPDAYLPGLAASLNSHAALLAETGQRDEAVLISEEAVCLRRELAELNRAAYLPDLAASLNNHSLALAETGQRDEAVLISEEAVCLRRELVELNRDAYLPNLATSLNNHSLRLAETGQRDEAVTVSEEVLRLHRELVELNRDAYLPNLATSLNNHAAHLAETGQRREAVPISEETVRLRRELVELNRDAYLPDLAGSLSNHAALLAETRQRPGRRAGTGWRSWWRGKFRRRARDEAVMVCGEAVRMHRELVELNRAAYLPNLAASLNNHAHLLAETGQRDEAVTVIAEAVRLYGELVELNRDAYLPDYIQSLTAFGKVLVDGARFREAIAPLVEAFIAGEHLPEYAQGILYRVADLLHHAYVADVDGVSEEFRKVTGEDVPDEMK
ncbi:tetratricopeptide repeat protein [Nonomuraea sp. SMC257]|uniref:Tetratricopeptide repeat protein n=1 Tax=Nonomuraea montanisoli TaxID=2741721 RepID=A0A7Y6M5M7_9ACTN|nr:tetratricopeptide repeat protein [Nonomuraea montanisoli]NUW34816.1 tetratricopeptide repeat protein [Nonomuraea montanisoli]